ncbi:VOC family protein [Alkalibacillus sp. S2W]|uniref:VOC family protein n=1 Tax=Alkalibacillus sp. S2W TaxID=3386553 RepID=UPI00398D39FF
MVLQRISLVTIGCHELPLLRQFYQDMGWEETDHGYQDFATFKTAGVMLSLFSVEELAKESGLEVSPLSPNVFKGITFSINVDEPHQVDAIIEQVKQAGGRVLKEPSGVFWGGYSASFTDPEYNFWEVAYNPDSTFDERGAMLTL